MMPTNNYPRKPGPELAAAMATRIMGWQRRICGSHKDVTDDGCLIYRARCEDCGRQIEEAHADDCAWMARHAVWDKMQGDYSDEDEPRAWVFTDSWRPDLDWIAAYEVLAVVAMWDVEHRQHFCYRLQQHVARRLWGNEGTTPAIWELILRMEPVDVCLAVLESAPPTPAEVRGEET